MTTTQEMLESISIHAPRTGSDDPHWKKSERAPLFQSTLPARGATFHSIQAPSLDLFQSTLPARGATAQRLHRRVVGDISIHAPRTGSDDVAADMVRQSPDFNPRSPHGERRPDVRQYTSAYIISIHAPRMGSDAGFARDDSQASISIHAPRMGSDARAAIWLPTSTNFNPRSPHGERRRRAGLQPHRVRISIHAPRMGSDDAAPAAPEKPAKFQSTLPAWGATRWKMRRCASCWHFNPRSPHGERR